MGGGRKKENITVPNERGFQEDTKEGSEPVQIERKEMTPPASFDENMPPAPRKTAKTMRLILCRKTVCKTERRLLWEAAEPI